MVLEADDKELHDAIGICHDKSHNGRGNGKKAAVQVIEALSPILIASPDPRIKALGLALAVGSQLFLGKRRRK